MQSINSRPAGECGCGEEHDTHAYIYLNPCTIPLAAVIAARMLTE